MQYLLSVINDRPDLATSDEQAAIDVFNDQLQADGYWVFAGGLGSPSTATVVDNRGEEPVFTDGPFVESKEFLIGFWVIEAPDLDVLDTPLGQCVQRPLAAPDAALRPDRAVELVFDLQQGRRKL